MAGRGPQASARATNGGRALMAYLRALDFEAEAREKFWQRVEPEPTSGCWLWVGLIDAANYGRYRGTAHRWSYEAFVAPVPDGLHLDHLCRNTRCVNPRHLEPVTPCENARRRDALLAVIRPTCPSGHAFTPENTRYRADRGVTAGIGTRVCRACEKARHDHARVRRLSLGLCERCGQTRVNDRFCQRHDEIMRARRRRRYLREKGLPSDWPGGALRKLRARRSEDTR